MNPQAQLERAVALCDAGRAEEAEPILRRLLASRPGHPLMSYLLAGVCAGRGDNAEALELVDAALRAKPGHPGALVLRGNVLQGLVRPAEALACYDAVLAARPGNAETLNNRGNALSALGRDQESLVSLDAAVAAAPDNAMFRFNRGSVLMKLHQHMRAVEDFSLAIALQPNFTAAISNRGGLFVAIGQFEQALADYDTVVALEPRNPHAHINRGGALMHLKRHVEALAAYDTALALEPNLPRVLGQMAIAAIRECDWPRVVAMTAPYQQAARDDAPGLDPLTLISYGGDPPLMLACARATMAEKLPSVPPPLWTGQRYAHDRLRIAYVSSDLHDHPVGYLMAPLLERHDRERFEIIIISTGQAKGGRVRERVIAASDHFHDMGETSDHDTAQTLLALETDIVVDLNGHTSGSRPGIFALRPAPVQASWLGFPGSTGLNCIDFLIADAIVAPHEQQPFYSERLVHLPGCVFPFDSLRTIGATPSRAEEGLPQTGFVFCCFNRHWKITAATFDIWMRVLQQVDGSVLWLNDYPTNIQQKLRDQAQARGVDATRLVFTKKRPIGEHLARHRLADLFLDTLPYNAHATAADALLAGLPVLTQLGAIFAGRVGASLAIAAGLPELVTQTAEEYENLALALARDPARLTGLRERLMQREGPLFDSVGFVRALEAAYLKMSDAR